MGGGLGGAVHTIWLSSEQSDSLISGKPCAASDLWQSWDGVVKCVDLWKQGCFVPCGGLLGAVGVGVGVRGWLSDAATPPPGGGGGGGGVRRHSQLPRPERVITRLKPS